MKYQITCAHCNKRFLVDGKGGQTIECICPGCQGKMRVNLPKGDKDSDTADDDDYQTGYAPTTGDGGDDNDGNGKRNRRGLALGCLIFIVIAVAAGVAFAALNRTTKQPIEDPYENVEPDTASVDTTVEDTMPEEVDTVEVHHEAPKEEAATADTAAMVESGAADQSADGQEGTEPVSDETTTDKPAATDKQKTKDAPATKSKDSKGSSKSAEDKKQQNISTSTVSITSETTSKPVFSAASLRY